MIHVERRYERGSQELQNSDGGAPADNIEHSKNILTFEESVGLETAELPHLPPLERRTGDKPS